MDINEALELLKARAEAIVPATVTNNPAAEVVVPMLVIDATEINYHESMNRGGCFITFTATLYASIADSESGLYEVREYLAGYGDKSIRAALETSTGDDDLTSRVVVEEAQRSDEAGYLTAVFTGRVHLSGPTQ